MNVGFKDTQNCTKKSSVVSTSKRCSRVELSNQRDKRHRHHQQLANLCMLPVDINVTQGCANQPNLVNAPMVSDSDSDDEEDKKMGIRADITNRTCSLHAH